MSIIVGCMISVVLIVVGVMKSKSEKIFFLQCVWCWILQGFNNGGMDYSINEMIYKGGGIDDEFISHIIIQFFLKLGINFMWYRVIISFFAVIIFAHVVKKYSERMCIVINLYYFFMLADNVTQIRYYFSAMMVLLAFSFLYENKKIFYYLTVIIAVGFHVSNIVFLIIPFIMGRISRENVQSRMRLLNVKVLAMIVAEMIILPRIVPILQMFNLSWLESKFVHYIYEENYSAWYIGLLFFAMYAFFLLSIQWIDRHSRNERTSEFDHFAACVCTASTFILPFMFYNSNFGRYFRPVLILAYIFISNHIGIGIKNGTLSKCLRDLFVCMNVAGGCIINIASGAFAFNLLFNHNYFLQAL